MATRERDIHIPGTEVGTRDQPQGPAQAGSSIPWMSLPETGRPVRYP